MGIAERFIRWRFIKGYSFWESKLNKICLFQIGILLVFLSSIPVVADNIIEVDQGENGVKKTGQLQVFHDSENKLSLLSAVEAQARGEFQELKTAGSTGLEKGAFWSYFALKNTSELPLVLHLEYVDHQLIQLQAYDKARSETNYLKIADLSLSNPFSQRPIHHNRFVFEVRLQPGEVREVLVKFSSDQMGFVFPSLRIWDPRALEAAHNFESNAMFFLFGCFFLTSIFALVAGVATQDKTFFVYTVYSLSKIGVWATVLGYTHQYLIQEGFHWSYMSITGAITIFCGLLFLRIFLHTKEYTPRLDKVILFMISNCIFLLVCAILKLTAMTVISITIALLLYPVLAAVGIIRWRQGSKEGVVFSIAWSFLIFGLVVQALRDLGFVEPSFTNYYWPPIASFTEMLAIMAAMGIKVQGLRIQKEAAEQKYTRKLENSKAELEQLVQERTRELADAKQQAELEARTDPLTGIHNRRSFFDLSELRFCIARRQQLSLSMLMMDIDHFKSINDKYGHGVGDEALLAFSQALVKIIRGGDIFGRVGGEEFALLVNDDSHSVLDLAERLRKAVEDISLDTSLGELKFTVSIGLAHFQEDDTVELLLKKSDMALYKAKNSGRNRVVELPDEENFGQLSAN